MSPRAAARREEVAARLRVEVDAVAARFEHELRSSHPLYQRIEDPTFNSVLTETTRAGVLGLADWLRTGGQLPEELAVYFTEAATAAATQFVPLDALEGPIQAGAAALWTWLVEAAGPTAEGREAALCLVGELKGFEDALQRTITDAYVAARFQPDVDEREAQRDLLEALLAGKAPDRLLRNRLAGSYGLVADSPCVVVLAQPDGGGRTELRRAQELAQQGAAGRRLLMAARGEEIVAVPSAAGGLDEVHGAAREWARQLRRVHRIGIHVAISTQGVLADVPDRYAEAQRMLAFAGRDPDGVITVSSLRLFDYVAMGGDPTAARLVAPAVRALLADDAARDGSYARTLGALADSDLNVGRAARTLFVHPNTVHYRLNRIAELTGVNPRTLHDLVDLLLALRQLEDGPERARDPVQVAQSRPSEQ